MGLKAVQVDVRVGGIGIAPENLVAALAEGARAALAEVQASHQAPKTFVRYVNGREGASEESVILPGPILYNFSWLPEVAEYALAFARARSPVKSGRFRDSWFAMVNGAAVSDLTSIPPDAELIITNDQPYSRKIETGHMHMSVPPGIVEDTRQALMARFGNLITVQRKFISLGGAYVLKTPGRRRKSQVGRDLSYPAVVINTRQF